MLAERVIEWTEDWKRDGLQQGRQEGEATLLLCLLKLRFGELDEASRARVQQADAETLLQWGDRVLSAASREAVFRS